MKYEAVKKYYEIMLKRERTSDQMYEALSDMLDKLWYDFTPEELEFANSLQIPELSNTECRIIAKLNLIKEIQMNTQTTHTSVFETKEDYLKLRTFWKQFHAEGKHKAVKVEYQHSKPNSSGYYDGDMGFHMQSQLTLRQHLIYLAAMGKPLSKALSETTYTETKNDIKVIFGWKLTAVQPFKLFGDAIDPKYQEAIIARINDFIKELK
jgi:hypothetical protein